MRSCFVLLTMLLTCTSSLLSQPKFLYGMYATGWGDNEGISWTGSTFTLKTRSDGSRLLNFWNATLGMNTFFLNSSNFPEGGEDNAPYVNYLYREYAAYPSASENFISSSKIIPIYRCFLITRAGESAYMLFSPSTAKEGNVIDFDTSGFAISAGAGSFTVSAKSPSLSGRLIRGLTVEGGESRQLRPREWNTIGKSAVFKLRFRFSADKGSNSLTADLTNLVSRQDHKNYQLLLKTFSVPSGNSEVVFPFALDVSGGEASYEAYVCRLGLRVDCTLQSGGSFQLRDITVYDDSGRVVVEETSKFFGSPKRRDLVTAFKNIAQGIAAAAGSPKVYPIIAVADEPHVSNFAPMDAVCRFLNAQDNRLTFYSTWPDDEPEHLDLKTADRFAKVGVRYVGLDHYPFRTGSTDSRSILYDYYLVLARYCAEMKSADPGKVIVSVPQLFSGGGNLRAPTRNEVLSSAYLSLVVGARGVVYYYSGPIWRSEEPLYTFHDETEWFERMFSLDSMDPEKIAALKTFASFINAPSGEQDGATNGDLLARFGVDKYYIVGTTDGLDRVNSRAFRSGELGTSSRADIAGISIVDESGNIVGDRNLVGLAHLADNSSRPNTTYYLVANMNASDSDVNLRIAFRSSNSRSFLRVSNLTYPDLLSDLVMSRTDAVQTRLPAHAAMILRIENID